jgi:excisionase family DNA binding protein
MPEPWVSAHEVASHLGVAKDSVYRWVETKGLPAHRVGSLWKFMLTEVDEWVPAGGAAARASRPRRGRKIPSVLPKESGSAR